VVSPPSPLGCPVLPPIFNHSEVVGAPNLSCAFEPMGLPGIFVDPPVSLFPLSVVAACPVFPGADPRTSIPASCNLPVEVVGAPNLSCAFEPMGLPGIFVEPPVSLFPLSVVAACPVFPGADPRTSISESSNPGNDPPPSAPPLAAGQNCRPDPPIWLPFALKVVTWNIHGLFVRPGYSSSQLAEKHRAIRNLMIDYHLIALQETHGTSADFAEAAARFPGWLVYGSATASRNAGGLLLLVSPEVRRQVVDLVFHEIVPGRAARLIIRTATATINFINVHSDPRASVPVRKAMFTRALRTAAPEESITTLLMGDFNITLPGDSRLDLENGELQHAEDLLGRWFTTSFPGLTSIDHPGFTRCGYAHGVPRYLSTLDYIMTDMPRAEVLDRHPIGHAIGDPAVQTNPSDHIPLAAVFHLCHSTPPNRKSFPSWLTKHPFFLEEVQAIAARSEFSVASPPELDDLVELLTVAGIRAQARLRALPPSGLDARLHWTLLAIRGLRMSRHAVVVKALGAYPALSQWIIVPAGARFYQEADRLGLHEHGRHLAGLVEDEVLRNTPVGAARSRAADRFIRRAALWKKHQGRARFSGIRGADGFLPASAEGAAQLLRDHWGAVFAGGPTDDEDIERFIAHIPADMLPAPVMPSLDDVKLMLASKTDSAPGPDGLRYSAWQAAGLLGARCLHGKLADMWEGEAAPASFRSSLLCFLPKVTDCGGYCLPGETRPIALSDTAYKAIASMLNRILAAALPKFIDERQRGFMRGRQGLDHVMELEAAAIKAGRLGGPAAALCLFDILAAFPSLSHKFLRRALRKFCGKHPLGRIIIDLYLSNEASLLLFGRVSEGFAVLAGVRQGCPLSGSLFALCFHAIIIDLQTKVVHQAFVISAKIFAYADDLGIILQDLWVLMPLLYESLRAAGRATNLHLNVKKTRVLPLWRNPLLDVASRRLGAGWPAWARFVFTLEHEYLGILVGPSATNVKRWFPAVFKFEGRVVCIAQMGVAWPTAIFLYNIFAMPVLSYVGQVVPTDALPKTLFARMTARLFKLPMNRFPYEAILALPDLHVPLRLRDARTDGLAARIRVSIRSRGLKDALQYLQDATSDDHLVVNPHSKWQAECTAINVSKASGALSPLELSTAEAQTVRMQHHICGVLRMRAAPFNFASLFAARLRKVILQSGLPLDPMVVGKSLQDSLLMSAAVLSPGILVSSLRLGTNSWATSHGFGNVAENCPFCSAKGGDRLSHYLQCGGVYVWVEESLPRIHWPIDDAIGRASAFFGGYDRTPDHSAATSLVHDLIHNAAKSARRNGVDGKSALTARLRAVMGGSPLVFNLLNDLDARL
jgi:endonuclease/exonuclease/phosphatase family metal-dependent hydrolase